MTLVYPIQGAGVLLGLKKLRIGKGTYVGFGGRVKLVRESIEEAAVRELEEESGLIAKVENLEYRGYLKIHNPKYEDLGVLIVHIFTLTVWEGEPHETDEMIPKWFQKSRLPWARMRESEEYWLPAVLNGRRVEVEIWYDIQEKIQYMRTDIVE